MFRFPSPQLILLAIVTSIVGFISIPDEPVCRGKAMSPGDTCRLTGGAEKSYEQMAEGNLPSPVVFFGAAAIFLVLAIAIALLRPKPKIFEFIWPGRTRVKTYVGLGVAIAATVAAGVYEVTAPITCNGQSLQPSEVCVDASTNERLDLASAPIRQPWLYGLIVVVLIVIVVRFALRRRDPNLTEIAQFEQAAHAARTRIDDLVTAGYISAEDRATKRQELDAAIEAERLRGGAPTNTVDS